MSIQVYQGAGLGLMIAPVLGLGFGELSFALEFGLEGQVTLEPLCPFLLHIDLLSIH